MNLNKEELNFLVSFFSHWANPFRAFDKSDICRRGYPFGGPHEIDLDKLIRKGAISESPNGYQIKLTDFGYELMKNHMRNKSDWSKQKVIRANLSDKNEVLVHKGNHYKGYEVVRDIFLSAKASLCIQDPYIGPEIFSLIYELDQIKIKVLLGKKPYKERASAILAYKQLKKEIDMIEMKVSSKIHNRYIFVDEKSVYQVGGSIKQLGEKDDIIRKINNVDSLLREFKKEWDKAKGA